jgi:TolB protein
MAANVIPVLDDGYENYSTCFSLDGTKIVYHKQIGTNRIFIINTYGTAEKFFTNTGIQHWGPSFSPNGIKIVCLKMDGLGVYQVVRMSGECNNVVWLMSSTSSSSSPSFTSDGNRIVFVRNGNIYTINADGSNEMQLTNNSDDDYYPSFLSTAW